MSTTDSYYYPHQVSIPILRAVWAAVTADPQAPIATLATRTGHCKASVGAALHQLREMEYIAFEPGCAGTRRVLFPYYILRRASCRRRRA